MPNDINQTTNPPWPLDRTPEDELRWLIKTCARPAISKRSGKPRWWIVHSLTRNVSGYSVKLCKWAGVDPHERCVRS